MKIAGRNLLNAFCARHTDARRWIEHWLSDAEAATWTTPQDLKDRYASVSFLAGKTIIFIVKGNEYRLDIVCAYQAGVVVVKWVGTQSTTSGTVSAEAEARHGHSNHQDRRAVPGGAGGSGAPG